jgi:hypothetical protein
MRNKTIKKFVTIPLLLACLLFVSLHYFVDKAVVTLEIEVQTSEVAQFFWSENKIFSSSAGYEEKNSRKVKVSPGIQVSTVSLPSINKIESLRFDPTNKIGEITVHSLSIKQNGYETINIAGREQLQKLLPVNDIETIENGANGLVLRITGNDPQLIVPIVTSFSVFEYVSATLQDMQNSVRSVSVRMDLLGITFFGGFLLLLDFLLVLSVSIAIMLRMWPDLSGVGENILALGEMALAFIVGTVLLLGVFYQLTVHNIFLLHIVIWCLYYVFLSRKEQVSFVTSHLYYYSRIRNKIFTPFVKLVRSSWKSNVSFFNLILLLVIAVILVGYLVPAAFTLPLNFDSNDYRLSRIGYWLQERNVWQFPTNDFRQIVLSANCDFVMLWITSFFSKGYPMVHLVSWFGGVLVCGALFSFFRSLGFALYFCLAVCIFWLGIPNSATQMFTSQTDLFTTGCLMSGLYFLYRAIVTVRGGYFSLAGLGIGLALGAKGTIFFWGPGLVLLFGCLVLFYRPPVRYFAKGMVVVLLLTVGLGGFVYGQNLYNFQNPFGPDKVVRSVKESKPALDRTKKGKPKLSKSSFYLLKTQAYVWQIFEPSSNLPIIHPVSNRILQFIEADLKKKNENIKSSFVSMFKTATSWVQQAKVSEDYLSFGMLSFMFFLTGGVLALTAAITTRSALSISMSVIFLSVICFFLFYCYTAGWTVHRYRYAVLLTPFIAILSIYSIRLLKRWNAAIGGVVLVLVLGYQSCMAMTIVKNSLNHGWPSLISPTNASNYNYYWKDVKSLTDQFQEGSHNIGLFLSKGVWSSLFFRQGPRLNAVYIASENYIKADEKFFSDNDIDVLVSKELSSVDVAGNYTLLRSKRDSVHALLKPDPDKSAESWFVKRGIWRDGWTGIKGYVVIGNWPDNSFPLLLSNPSPVAQTVILRVGKKTYELLFQPQDDMYRVIDVDIQENTRITWRVRPGYYPWKTPGNRDNRSLGVKMRLPKIN